MKKFVKGEKGLSLVELLAVLAIGSILILLISTIHIFVQNQYNNQSAGVKQLTDITIAVKAITKDIRSADQIEISEDFSEITLIIDGDPTSYLFEKDTLKKDGHPYIYELEKFEVQQEDSKISLTLENQSGKEIKTEIVMRGG